MKKKKVHSSKTPTLSWYKCTKIYSSWGERTNEIPTVTTIPVITNDFISTGGKVTILSVSTDRLQLDPLRETQEKHRPGVFKHFPG